MSIPDEGDAPRWRSRPRSRLDWSENYRHYLFVITAELGLILFGVLGIGWPTQPGDRWFGLFLLLMGASLAAFLMLYLRRPVPRGKSHRAGS